MKKIFSIVFILTAISLTAQTKYICRNGVIGFFSATPMEDIKASTNTAVSILDTNTKHISVKMLIKTFLFDNKLMMDHFNENYMESDKYPYSVLEMDFKDSVNFSKPGVYPVTLEGVLEMHGVKKQRKISGKITVKADGKISGEAEFLVPLKDHNITVPKMVVKNIAEEIKTTATFDYIPFKK